MWAGRGRAGQSGSSFWPRLAAKSQVTSWVLGHSLPLTPRSLPQVVEPRPQSPVAFSGT